LLHEPSGSTPAATLNVAFFDKSFSTAIAPKEATGGFINPSKIEDGGSLRIAILSEEPITGQEIWLEKDGGGFAVRRTAALPTPALISELEADVDGNVCVRDGKPAINTFCAFFAWDFESESVKIFSATQKSILRELDRLTSDEDYSNLGEWDLQIGRTGKGVDTRYTVDFKPTKRKGSIAARVAAAWEEAQANRADLGALFTGGNPFGGTDA
jgi:hypothetical protein